MKDETILSLAAIIALMIIEVACIINSIDSTLTGAICAIIGGIAGYKVKERRMST